MKYLVFCNCHPYIEALKMCNLERQNSYQTFIIHFFSTLHLIHTHAMNEVEIDTLQQIDICLDSSTKMHFGDEICEINCHIC